MVVGAGGAAGVVTAGLLGVGVVSGGGGASEARTVSKVDAPSILIVYSPAVAWDTVKLTSWLEWPDRLTCFVSMTASLTLRLML